MSLIAYNKARTYFNDYRKISNDENISIRKKMIAEQPAISNYLGQFIHNMKDFYGEMFYRDNHELLVFILTFIYYIMIKENANKNITEDILLEKAKLAEILYHDLEEHSLKTKFRLKNNDIENKYHKYQNHIFSAIIELIEQSAEYMPNFKGQIVVDYLMFFKIITDSFVDEK